MQRWDPGTVVTRREVLHGEVWLGFATYVVEDSPDLLAVYLAEGSPLVYADWPGGTWQHPWEAQGHTAWSGHGKLMLHRPGEACSLDVFWSGEDRAFAGWYVNLQDPVRRYADGYDTLDHELDYWHPAGGAWTTKDAELFEQRIDEGRYSTEEGDRIRATGASIKALLDRGETWWDPAWAAWEPPPEWGPAAPPDDWQHPPV